MLLLLLLLSDVKLPQIETSFFSLPENVQRGNNNSNGKVAAIVVGGAAALFLGFIFLSVIRSWGKKEDD